MKLSRLLPVFVLLLFVGLSHAAGFKQNLVMGVTAVVAPTINVTEGWTTGSCSGTCPEELQYVNLSSQVNQSFWVRSFRGNESANMAVNTILVEVANSTQSTYNVTVYAEYLGTVLFKQWVHVGNATTVRSPDNVTYILFRFNKEEMRKMALSDYLVVNTTLVNATVSVFFGDEAEQELKNKMGAVAGIILVGAAIGGLGMRGRA